MTVAPGARRPAVRAVTVLAVGAALAVIYGSWLPFALNFDVLERGLAGVWARLHLPRPNASDALANVLIHAPISMLLVWRGMMLGRHWARSASLALVFGALTAILAEVGQTLVPVRDPSLTDILFNLCGTLTGVVLARPAWRLLQALITRLRATMAVRPVHALFWVVGGMVVFAKLAPFDFTLCASDLEASLTSARWNPIAGVQGATPGPFLADLTDIAGSFFAFVILGIVAGLAHRETGESRIVSASTAIAKLGFLALAIEVLQLIIGSHTCDMADALTYFAGGIVGAHLGVTVVDRRWRDTHDEPGTNPALRVLLGMAVAIQIGMIAVCALPADNTWVSPSMEAIRWLPFSAHLEVPFAVGLGRIISSTMWYLVLAVLAVVIVPCRSMAYSLTMSLFLTVGVVTLTEGMQAFTVTRYADVTEPLLAGMAAVIATTLYWSALMWRERLMAQARIDGLARDR